MGLQAIASKRKRGDGFKAIARRKAWGWVHRHLLGYDSGVVFTGRYWAADWGWVQKAVARATEWGCIHRLLFRCTD